VALEVDEYVTIVKQDSWKPISGVTSCDFCFVDASHEYQDVKNDLEYWLPRSKVIYGDDYGWDGVRQAVTEMCPDAIPGHFWSLDPNPYYKA
jgi:hypothetical protein